MASRGNRHCASCIPMPETFSVLELSCISWAVLYRILSASRVKNDFFIQSWFTASSAACVAPRHAIHEPTRTPDIVGVQRRVVSVVVFDGRYLSGRGRHGPSELPANIPSHCSDKNKRARNKTILINWIDILFLSFIRFLWRLSAYSVGWCRLVSAARLVYLGL